MFVSEFENSCLSEFENSCLSLSLRTVVCL